jgi:hypothetical protein
MNIWNSTKNIFTSEAPMIWIVGNKFKLIDHSFLFGEGKIRMVID